MPNTININGQKYDLSNDDVTNKLYSDIKLKGKKLYLDDYPLEYVEVKELAIRTNISANSTWSKFIEYFNQYGKLEDFVLSYSDLCNDFEKLNGIFNLFKRHGANISSFYMAKKLAENAHQFQGSQEQYSTCFNNFFAAALGSQTFIKNLNNQYIEAYTDVCKVLGDLAKNYPKNAKEPCSDKNIDDLIERNISKLKAKRQNSDIDKHIFNDELKIFIAKSYISYLNNPKETEMSIMTKILDKIDDLISAIVLTKEERAIPKKLRADIKKIKNIINDPTNIADPDNIKNDIKKLKPETSNRTKR